MEFLVGFILLYCIKRHEEKQMEKVNQRLLSRPHEMEELFVCESIYKIPALMLKNRQLDAMYLSCSDA